MTQLSLYNLFQTAHIGTSKYYFECVFNSSSISRKDEQNTITHLVKPVGSNAYNSLIFEGNHRDLLDDYCLLLSIMQGNYIHYANSYGLPVLNKLNDFELFLSSEIGSFLDTTDSLLSKYRVDNNPLFDVLCRALLLYYEAKYLLIYDESQSIVMMHLFEFLLGGIYRIDLNINNKDDVRLEDSFSHICKKYQYQKYVDDRLKSDIKPKRLSIFKKEKGVQPISSFASQFNQMRNRIQHGKQQEKPLLNDSPSNFEFTFFYRLENLIRVILADELGSHTYERKFDVLYQLVLEMNVCPTFTPDVNELRFIEK